MFRSSPARARRVCVSSSVVIFLLLAARAAHGQNIPAFRPPPSYPIVVPLFADTEVAHLLDVLDARVAEYAAPAAIKDLERVVVDFTRRIQAGRLTPPQETRIASHLSRLGRTMPASAGVFRTAQRVIREFTIGKTAPNIIGKDLEGRPLRLSDHRGKVVVVAFSGEWCGICRTEYPYERLLLELYRNWPFAMLGVDSGDDASEALKSRAAQGLTFPAWWDGPGGGSAPGPIAEAWLVSGWPTTYVLDGEGVIRFIDVRKENLLKAVKQLLDEQLDTAPATRSRR